MSTEMQAIISQVTDLAASVSDLELEKRLDSLMVLSEALWEKASQQAGPEITELFSTYIEVEELIRWLQGCRQHNWLSSKIAQTDVEKTLTKALAFLGDDLDKVLEGSL
jgi:hypothetical protein